MAEVEILLGTQNGARHLGQRRVLGRLAKPVSRVEVEALPHAQRRLAHARRQGGHELPLTGGEQRAKPQLGRGGRDARQAQCVGLIASTYAPRDATSHEGGYD